MIDVDAPVDPAPPTRRKSPAFRVIVAGLAVVLAMSASAGGFVAWGMGGAKAGAAVRVVVPEGASAQTVATLLARAHVVRSALVFRLVSKFRGVSTEFKPGTYVMRAGLGVSAAIAALRKGVPPHVERFTIPEGKTVAQIARIVGEKTHVKARAFLDALARHAARPSIAPAGKNFEGFLFPKTYDIELKASADDVVAMMLSQFEKETASLDIAARARALGITPYQALILASLIEREARIDKDRPLISSVIYNRLARPMRLQIDATVQYAIELKTGEYKGTRLTQRDYTSVRSPYNTYLHDGLPPAPIASPGLAALRAALHPARTGYYYYVLCDAQGGHAFARTSKEFSRLLARCR